MLVKKAQRLETNEFPQDRLQRHAETVAELGTKLMLPPWLEQYRSDISQALKPIAIPTVPVSAPETSGKGSK